MEYTRRETETHTNYRTSSTKQTRVSSNSNVSTYSSWIPHVELASTTEELSTLASKIISMPKYSQIPSKYKQHASLDRLNTRQQEALILEDILHIMMGCEGFYIRYSETFDPTIEFDRLKGPEYRISKSLDPSLKDLTRSIIEIARHFLSIKAFTESQSKPDYGLVNQALCASMRKTLTDYNLLTAQLERQVMQNLTFTLHNMNVQLGQIGNKLRHCYDLVHVILRANEQKAEEATNIFNDFDKVLESLKESGSKDLNELAVSGARSAVCKGGTILRILAERLKSHSGDPTAKQLYQKLLHDASQPYLKMLSQWIHKGVINDPHDEFLVRELKSIKRERLDMDYTDEYWEKRYTIRKDDLPLQLMNPDIYEKVLLAGKYLNVVRECGGTDVSKTVNETFDSIEDSRIVLSLTEAYTHANQSLLSLLVKTHELPARLRSLKHYYFLDQADFFINFMDIAEQELSKPSRKASITKLQYLLDMSLRQPGSISATDPFKDEVLVDMSHISVTDYLLKIVNVSGMDPNEAVGLGSNQEVVERMVNMAAQNNNTNNNNTESSSTSSNDEKRIKNFTATMGLQLDFKIPFPTSLVLSRKTILRYQLLFRHLVELKNIERNLNNSWIESMKSKAWRQQSSINRLEQWKKRATNLRVKMLLFVQQVLYFCTMEVIEPNWAKLEAKLQNSKTVDLLMEQHVYYLDSCMKECMLTNQKLLKLQAKLYMACRMFGEFLLQRTKTLLSIDPSVLSPTERVNMKKVVGKDGQELSPEELLTWLENTLSQYESSFDHHLKVLMEALNYFAATETTVLLSLSARLEVCMMTSGIS